MTRTYRAYLKAIGRKPVDPNKLRTVKSAGDVEIAWCPRRKDYVRFEHEGMMGE